MMKWQSMIDLFICICHFCLSVVLSGTSWFMIIISSFIFFFKFSLMDVRYTFQLMKARGHPIFSQDSRLSSLTSSVLFCFFLFLKNYVCFEYKQIIFGKKCR